MDEKEKRADIATANATAYATAVATAYAAAVAVCTGAYNGFEYMCMQQ